MEIPILCNSINNVDWRKSDAAAVHYPLNIWRLWIPEVMSDISDISEFFLNAAELSDGQKFHQEKDRQRWLCSKVALRMLLSAYMDCGPQELYFNSDENKKPRVTGRKVDLPAPRFNISHAGDMVLIAINRFAEIGIDVEKINEEFTFDDLVSSVFNNQEKHYLLQHPHQKFFFLVWTRKESIAKFTGKGINDDFCSLPGAPGVYSIEIESAETLQSLVSSDFIPEKEYAACLTYPAAPYPPLFYAFDAVYWFQQLQLKNLLILK